MFALLVPSGCDAAYFLAYNLGFFFNDKDFVEGFVDQMNKEAKVLGM